MNLEKQALLDQAARCRQVATELAHAEAAQRLRAMADDFAARAADLEQQQDRIRHRLRARNPSRNGVNPSG